MEKTKCTNFNSGWLPEHIIIKDKKEIIGFIPNFKKLNSFGEYVFDQIFENAYHQTNSEYFPKFLSATPFTPVTRAKFVYSSKRLDNQKILNLLIKFLKKREISSFHANFINFETSNFLEKHDFYKRVGIQYHWKNRSFKDFNDFLNSLKSRKKKSIIKERKSLKERRINFVRKQGKMIKENDMEELFNCYLCTINKKWSQAYLNRDFFVKLISTPIARKMLIISAYDQKKFLGSSVHFIGKDTLYGRYWGSLEEVPYLHFELCYYQAIEFAIEEKLKKIEAGAQGEHKISRGYTPCLTYSNHWFNNDILRKPIKKYLEKENKRIIDAMPFLEKYTPFTEGL
jgi:hypothetical protein